MRIVFASSDSISIPLLEALNEKSLVSLVLTTPDQREKRGNKLVPNPLKVRALELGLEVYDPESLKKDARNKIRENKADVLISFSYGKIFGPMFLSLFKYTFNIHPSLLPKYRGCSPLYATILNQDRVGGITVQRIGEKVDEGEIYKTLQFELDGSESKIKLEEKVSHLVPSLFLSVLDNLNSITPYKQEGEESWTDFVKKDDGKLDFSDSASTLHAIIRASLPWPKAYAYLEDKKILITGVSGSSFDIIEKVSEEPGTICSYEKGRGLKVATTEGYLYITKLLPPMKKEMDAISFVNGYRPIGKVFR